MARVRIWTAPDRLIGEVIVEDLRKAGLPAVGMLSGTDLYPASPLWDIYLEDEELLKDPGVRQTIEDAIDARPLTPEEETEVAQMPFAEPPRAWGKSKRFNLWASFFALLLLACLIWLVVGYLNRMFAGQL